MRKIAAVTVGRSDFGIYLPVLRTLQADRAIELQIIASGSHLSATYGHTVDEITANGFQVTERVDMLLSSDSPQGIAKSMGLAVLGFADVMARLKPDILLVLGDRFEMHAAASAAVPFQIPIAHIHGGEVTSGAVDEAFRHAITKYAHLHFASTEEHARRIIQLGEEPWRVSVAGAPSLDNLKSLTLLSAAELERAIGIPLDPAPLLATYHPVTLEHEQAEFQIDQLLHAIDELDLPMVITKPNADTNNHVIIRRVNEFARQKKHVAVIDNLGTRTYFSLMARARAMVGNSSSGIIEAAAFELPVVNVGIRQLGRPRSLNVIDVGNSRHEILTGLRRAIDPGFRASLHSMENIYGRGDAADHIADRLTRVSLDKRLLLKRFHDLPMTSKHMTQAAA